MAAQQLQYLSGQNVAPYFEGWEQNSDGSFNLVFGYLNRNWEQEFHLPVGPGNNLEPGGPDQGQPSREWWRLGLALTGAAEPVAWNRQARQYDLDDAKGLVEAHGGRMWAENNASGGATFRLTLPAAPQDDREV